MLGNGKCLKRWLNPMLYLKRWVNCVYVCSLPYPMFTPQILKLTGQNIKSHVRPHLIDLAPRWTFSQPNPPQAKLVGNFWDIVILLLANLKLTWVSKQVHSTCASLSFPVFYFSPWSQLNVSYLCKETDSCVDWPTVIDSMLWQTITGGFDWTNTKCAPKLSGFFINCCWQLLKIVKQLLIWTA